MLLGHFVLLFALICTTQCEHSPSHSVEDLYTILDQTTEYFKNLSNVYKVPSPDTSDKIDDAISEYVKNTTRAIRQQRSERRKRDVQTNFQHGEDVVVLQDFKETLSINLTGFQDVDFFPAKNDEDRLSWFAVALNSSNMLLYQLINNELYLLGTYSQSAGSRIIVNNYGADTLIIMQKQDSDGIVVLRYGRNGTGNHELQFKQEFEIPGVTHMNTWLCMNQVYLAIASKANIFVYAWLGEHFDIIDTIAFGARKILPFRNKSFVRIAAVGSVTKIFRFSVRSNKFVETQRLRRADDVDSFRYKEGHFEEQFLVLANGDDSTILYKEMYNRFVPFQTVAPTRHVHSLTMANTVVLLFSDELTTTVYQYDGWRFASLQSRTGLSDMGRIRRIRSHGEDVLIQSQDGMWKFAKPIWLARKTWESMQNEIDTWCSETLRKVSSRTFGEVPNSPKNLVMSNAHIDRLRVQNINGYNAEELIRLTRQYKAAINKLNLIDSHFAREETESDKDYIKSMIVHGKKLTVKCNGKCHVNRLITESKVIYENNAEIKKMDSLKVDTINNWQCPIPNFNVDAVSVRESVNGLSMQSLQEETLKTSGDQVVSGKHTFTNLRATNVSMPLNVMTKSNKHQIVQIQEARVKDLRLTDDEFFLPVNGSAIVMNRSIIAPRVRVTGTIDLRAAIKGEGRKILEPVKDILTPLTLSGNRYLQHVTFAHVAKVGNIVSPTRARSLKHIVENIVPLDSDVPTHLTLSGDKTSWNNVTLWNYKNWVTKNSPETVVISGAKSARNVVLTNTTFANLPLPRLTIPLCAVEVITPAITTSSLTIDDLKVETLNVTHIRGARNLNTTVFESASTWDDVDFSTKLFTGRVVIKNISATEIRGIDQIDFNSLRIYELLDENRFKGSLSIEKLSVSKLEMPVSLNLSLPTRVRNVVVKADSDIKRINGVDVQLFIRDAARVDDAISLEHTTFTNGFTSNHVNARRSAINLSHFDVPSYFRSKKRISTTLKTSAINIIPYRMNATHYHFMNDVPSRFIIQGSVRFLKEPIVKKIKNVHLKELSENLWMADRDTVVLGSNIYVKNLTLGGGVTIFDKHHRANSLHMRVWLDLSNRLLSKTREQHIAVVSSFKSVEMPSVVATSNSSRLRSSDLNLNDLLTNSLMRNATQIVNISSWRFKELDINSLDDIRWNGKFNGLDLNTDIVRRDAKHNYVTGKKTISGLTVKDLWLLDTDFSEFVRNSLSKKCDKMTVIKGQKTFVNITLNNLSVKGGIMGRTVEDMLLKSGNQTVFGVKRIHGQLNVPTLISNGIVNDVNLIDLTNTQVKKHRATQTIEDKIDFANNLEILGDITVDEFYEEVNMRNISGQNKLEAVLDRTTQVVEFTEDVAAALQNRAVYVDKFEAVAENTLSDVIFNASDTEDATDFNGICSCESNNTSVYCNDTKLLNILAGTNSGALVTKKLALLDDAVFATVILSNLVSISSYNVADDRLEQKIRLHVPGVLEASVESADNSLWIVLRLSAQTLVLHYQTWNELEQYTLPGSDVCVTDKTPNDQRVLIRSDGVWILEGASRPRHVFRLPLNGQVRVFADRADYYVKATTENGTVVLKARYVGYRNN